MTRYFFFVVISLAASIHKNRRIGWDEFLEALLLGFVGVLIAYGLEKLIYKEIIDEDNQ